jgi:2-C-methyl-D-erythritol 2,4-cyclodiphosphate synthase
MRIGIGYDVHQLVEGRKLILGGVEIEHEMGLLGHSDADVLVHSLMDAILGAMAEGDIGKHFPDTDQSYKDISSLVLLGRVKNIMRSRGYRLVNADCVVAAQRPKLALHIDKMRENIAEILETSPDNIGIKATTTEWLGFEGREEGISAQAVCLIEKMD